MNKMCCYHQLLAEGQMGRIFARLRWSDGAVEDVPPARAHELHVTSLNPRVLKVDSPTNATALWTAAVAPNAVSATGEMLLTEWRQCGSPVISTYSWVSVTLPQVTNVALTASEARLAPAGARCRGHNSWWLGIELFGERVWRATCSHHGGC